jgi:hypothetical protein
MMQPGRLWTGLFFFGAVWECRQGGNKKQWWGAQSMSGARTRRAMAGGVDCFLNTMRVWGRREEEWECKTGCHLAGGTGASRCHISERREVDGQAGSEWSEGSKQMLVSCEARWIL